MTIYRSKFDVLMEVLTVFYEHDNVRISFLMRKANIASPVKNDIIDLLIAKNVIVVNDHYLLLTDSGRCLVSDLVPKYKKIKGFYLDNFTF